MKNINLIFSAHLLTAVGALAISFAQGGFLEAALVAVFFGGLWFFSQQQGMGGWGTILLFLFGVTCGVGFWMSLTPVLLLVTIVATLGAWDLDQFSQRLRSVERVDLDSGLGKNHLKRLFAIEALGLLAGLAGLTARIQITFWAAVLLVILALFGISRLVIFIKKELE
jgi:hypothetical protein